MARRKHVALFEVIKKDSRLAQNGGALRPPAWWYKSKPVAPSSVAPPPPPEPVVKTTIMPQGAPPPAAPIESGSNAIQQDANDSWPVVASNDLPAPPDSRPRHKGRGGSSPLTPTSAAIIGIAALIVVVFALSLRYLHHHGGAAQAALNGPAHPDVLNVGPNVAQQDTAAPSQPPAPQAKQAAATEGPSRQANLLYVVVHQYVNPKTANDVCTFLNRSGISCSVEHNLKNLIGPPYALVGLTSFTSGGTPEYLAYVQHLKEVLATLPGATQITRSIRPNLYRWVQTAGPA